MKAREKLREIADDSLRALVMDCAAEVIAREGVHGLSIEQIARRLSISKSTFYRVFDSKRSLLVTLAIEDYDEFAHLADKLLEGRVVSVKALEELFRAACDIAWKRKGGALAHALLPVLPEVGSHARFREAASRVLNRTSALIGRCRTRKSRALLPAAEMARFALSAIVNAVPDTGSFNGSVTDARDALAWTIAAACVAYT